MKLKESRKELLLLEEALLNCKNKSLSDDYHFCFRVRRRYWGLKNYRESEERRDNESGDDFFGDSEKVGMGDSSGDN